MFTLLIFTIINLGIGLIPYIDNFCHLGGFYFGFLFGMSMFAIPDHIDPDGTEHFTYRK